MNAVNRYVSTPSTMRQRVLRAWLLSSLALVLTLANGVSRNHVDDWFCGRSDLPRFDA